MKLEELEGKLNLKRLSVGDLPDRQISGGYCSDLLSDVIGHAVPDMVWITIQTHLNVIAVACLKDLAAVIFVHGQEPDSAVIAKAREEGLSLFVTDKDSFHISARLFDALVSDGTISR